MNSWPNIVPAKNPADSQRAAEQLWSVMGTRPPADGPCYVYRLVDAHLRPQSASRRRPVVDELLAPPTEGQVPRVLLRHDVDSWEGMERWLDWERRRGPRGVYLLRCQMPEGATLSDGTRAAYLTPPQDYNVEDRHVRDVVEAGLKQGCRFGLHYGSARLALVQAEYSRLRDALDLPAKIPASAHWLQSSGQTLAALDDLGVCCDFSLMDFESCSIEIPPGEPRHPGFLTGTTHPHLLWDMHQQQWLNLLAVPGALEENFVAGRMPTRPGPADIDRYIDLFVRHRGVLVLLWHAERFDLAGHLERIVDRLRELAFRFITTDDLVPPIPGGVETVDDPRC
jgi:hypothetical protein